MPPKLTPSPVDKSSTYGESEDTFYAARSVTLTACLDGIPPTPSEWLFFIYFNGQILVDLKWRTDDEPKVLELGLKIDLKNPKDQLLISEKPLIFILRALVGKSTKDLDPIVHPDNRAGANVDLFPLLIGEEVIFHKVPLVHVDTGKPTDCFVKVHVVTSESGEPTNAVPLTMTLVSAHCLPVTKETHTPTVYIGAICLNGAYEEGVIKFGSSLSTVEASKSVWGSCSASGHIADTHVNAPKDDVFVPEDLTLNNTEFCRSYYWNSMSRRLVDPDLLREWFASPFVFELAGVPKVGKVEVRGRYMCFVDAGALLQPGVLGVSVSAKVLAYSESKLPGNMGGFLDLPLSSGRASARDADFICDEFQHNAYIVIRFDLFEPLVPKVKIVALFDTIGLKPPEGPSATIDLLDEEPSPEDLTIDVKKIKKEGGALAVHKELSGLACRGAVPMNQGIKRTAANRLLMRVRSMLKQFPPGNCSYVEWQDTVTGQHAASRRAVSASFAPQPPPIRTPPRVAAARCRMAGDIRTSDKYLKAASRNAKSPRYLICKALRCLEERNDIDAKNYILEGLSNQPRNRFLLWIFAGNEFNKGVESSEMASAALRVSVKSDYSDGTANAIGWAALHTIYHFNKDPYGAFISARKMRKSYELPVEWSKFYDRWIEESGEEETFWIPTVICSTNPFFICAAFFLCLRCYKFSELILDCVDRDCASSGSRLNIKRKVSSDIFYIRAASLILRRKFEEALSLTSEAIKRFGPNAMLSQMRVTCLSCLRGWDGECKIALECSEHAGSEQSPAILLKAALGGMNSNPEAALQRAARAHKIAPSGYTALAIARIYAKMNELGLAERWAAAAVKLEPYLSDGWAVLALLAMYDKHLNRARSMLRTAKQTGPLSPDIAKEVNKILEIVQLELLPDSLVKSLCMCDYN